MGFVKGLVRTCNSVCEGLKIKRKTRQRDPKDIPGYVTTVNGSSKASRSHKSGINSETWRISSSEPTDLSPRSSLDSPYDHVTIKASSKRKKVSLKLDLHSVSSTSSVDSLDISAQSSLNSHSDHVTTKSSSKSTAFPLDGLDSQSDQGSDSVSTSHRSLDDFDSSAEHVTSKALKNGTPSRSGLDSQSGHVSNSHPVPRSRHFVTPRWLSKHGSHRRLDGLLDTREHVPRSCNKQPRWLSKHTNHRRLDGIDDTPDHAPRSRRHINHR